MPAEARVQSVEAIDRFRNDLVRYRDQARAAVDGFADRRPIYALADLKVRIETGRQHQIRVHLALEGTPIAGDKLYTFDDAFFIAICARPDDPELLARLPFDRHALHAWRVELPHPETGERVEVEAPLPRLWTR